MIRFSKRAAAKQTKSNKIHMHRAIAEALEPRQLLSAVYSYTEGIIPSSGVTNNTVGPMVAVNSTDYYCGVGKSDGSSELIEISPGLPVIAYTFPHFDPTSGLAVDSNGYIVGAGFDSASQEPTVFRFDPVTKPLITYRSFSETNAFPFGSVYVDSSDNLFFASSNGSNSDGFLFEYEPVGDVINIFYTFHGTDGISPNGLSSDGNKLYGTTFGGGAHSNGTLFSYDLTSNNLTTLYSFDASVTGNGPEGSVAFDSSGNLYGSTSHGGPNAQGTIFKYDPTTATLSNRYVFTSDDGSYASGQMAIDSSGDMFGTSRLGGSDGLGTVWELPAGSSTLTTIHHFSDIAEQPNDGVTIDPNGNIIGTATTTIGRGAIWILTPQYLVVTPSVSSVTAGQSFSVNISLEDGGGNVISPDFSYANLFLATGPFDATFAQTSIIISDTVTISNLTLDTAGTYTFEATGGAFTGVSTDFTVVPDVASKLAFGTQPQTSTSNGTLPNLTVITEDQFGNAVTTGTPSIALTLTSGPSATFAGTLIQTATAGAATFNDLSVNAAGVYALTASSNGLTDAFSNPFAIAANGSIRVRGGIVSITGTDASDTISAGTNPGDSSQFYFEIQSPDIDTQIVLATKTDVTGLLINADSPNASPSGSDDDLINIAGTDFGFPVIINGGAGNDTISGQINNNIITTGSGANIVYGGAGDDLITGGGSGETLRSGGGADTIIANTGNNILVGGADGSNLYAGTGHDTLRAGAGNSTLHGGTGDSLLLGGFGDDLLTGGRGNDTLIAGSGQSTLNAGTGRQFLDAGWDDYLILNGGNTLPDAGNDSINASTGANDTIVANTGSPHIATGLGQNLLVYNAQSVTSSGYDYGTDTRIQNDTVSTVTQSDYIFLNIQIVNNGVTTDVAIPTTAGENYNATSAVQASNAYGEITFQSNGIRYFTLADFFNHWGVAFSSTGIGQYQAPAGGTATLTMTVNGIPASTFGATYISNASAIVITYTAG